MSGVVGSPLQSDGRFGFQVSAIRRDELDLLVLESLTSRDEHRVRPSVLDLGCGMGAMSVALAAAGAQVLAIDRNDFSEELTAQCQRCGVSEDSLLFRQATAPQDLISIVPTAPWDIIYSQRMLHYLRRSDAFDVLVELRRCSSLSTHLYLGASGLNSELGIGYEVARLPVAQRFGALSAEMSAKHEIREPVCLYTVAELVELVSTAGFAVVKAWDSNFGNVKLVAKAERLNVSA
jgi:SAM-dependent methyltransferase